MRSSVSLVILFGVLAAGTAGAQGKAHPCAPIKSQQACDEWRKEMARINAPKGPQPPRGTDQWLSIVNNTSWPVTGTAIFYMPYWPSDSYTGTAENTLQAIAPKSSVSIKGYGTTGDSPYVPMTSTFVTTDVGTLTLPATGSFRGGQCATNSYVLTLNDGPPVAYASFSGAVLGRPAAQSLACQIMACPGGGSYMGGNTVVYKQITSYAPQATGTWSCGN